MHWDMIGVLIAAMTTCTGAIRWFIRAIVREENAVQLKQINGTYVRSAGSNITGAEILRRLNELESGLHELGQN